MLGLHAERLADIALTAPEPHRRRAPSPRRAAGGDRGARPRRSATAPSDPWVLDGISFRIEAGESVAIAGPSGCGKTTLAEAAGGAAASRPRGAILVNGEPLSRLGPEAWRAMIGVVMQDDSLFAGSIADNIAFFAGGRGPRPDRGLRPRRRRSTTTSSAMPMGYGTLIGDMGTVLSGGQKQRVLLARALYRAPGAAAARRGDEPSRRRARAGGQRGLAGDAR